MAYSSIVAPTQAGPPISFKQSKAPRVPRVYSSSVLVAIMQMHYPDILAVGLGTRTLPSTTAAILSWAGQAEANHAWMGVGWGVTGRSLSIPTSLRD